MRLTVVTPLFPPDVHDVASYHKDLVTRLAREHTVTVALYGHLPENVPGVTFNTIDKRTKVTTRLWLMFRILMTLRTSSDWFIVTNGPSTELPALALSFFTSKPILLITSDTIVPTRFYAFIHTWLKRRTHGTVTLQGAFDQLVKPEIHPLITMKAEALVRYEAAWNNHLATITHNLAHVTHQ
jgi:hypothetical protein